MKMDSEVQIYEDVSKFIQIFKKCLGFLESIIQNAKKKDQLVVYIEKQKHYLKQLLSLAEKYSSLTDSLNIDHNTFSRFSNRLIETICLLRTQLSSCLNSDPMLYLSELFKNLERAINKNQNEKKFKQLIADTYRLFLNLCLKLEQTFLIESTMISNTTDEISKEKILESMQNKRRENLKNDQNSVFCKLNSNSFEQTKKINDSKPELSKINKTIGLINSRYDALKCLDIDYQYFKSSTFQAIQRSAVFQKQYLSRNEESGKFVKNYHDDFSLFLKKKELKFTRKNKKVVLQTDFDCNTGSVNTAIQEFKQRKGYVKHFRGKLNQTLNQRSIADNLSKTKDEQLERKQQFRKAQPNGSNKSFYSVKNMFLIFGKKNNKSVQKKDRKQQKQEQKKVLQTHSINLSIYTEESYKSSPGLRQRPFRQQTNMKQLKRQDQIQPKINQKHNLTMIDNDQKKQEDSILSNPRKRIIKPSQYQPTFEKTITQMNQQQNFPFKIERTIKYRSKIEPKLRNIIFKSKQI